jgi:hypothetical protein
MPATATKKKSIARKKVKKDFSKSYNTYKVYGEKQYSGMKVGGSHKWYYDKGVWRDKKITPDLWEIHYAVTKRRAGKAPTGSGAAVGTGYHWYILAHQNVIKLNADNYSTVLSGLKFKVSHKRAAKGSWSSSAAAQRKTLIKLFKEMIRQLEKEPVALQFEYNDIKYKGEAMPIESSKYEGRYYDYDISLNGTHFGMLHRLKHSWKIEGVEDEDLVELIGNQVDEDH